MNMGSEVYEPSKVLNPSEIIGLPKIMNRHQRLNIVHIEAGEYERIIKENVELKKKLKKIKQKLYGVKKNC